jgi:regulator of sigma E protease
VGASFGYTLDKFKMIFTTIGSLAKGAFGGDKSLLAEISGPVGIAKYAGSAFSYGFTTFLSFVALISVNLAVINLLPFPALDGGRFILEIFSSKGRSRIPERAVSIANQTGFVLLIALMLYVTYNDIVRLFS